MINPFEFFKVAEDLANAAEDKEAVFRTSISRAYYAAYHEVADKYSAKTSTPRSDRIFENHQNFIHQLKQMQSEPKFKTLGRQLHDLKSDRTNADYKLDRDITRNTARKSLAASRRILSCCQGL
jgi:uncharacterized protein (UPF0332 family)